MPVFQFDSNSFKMSRVQLLLQENAAIRAKIDQYSGKEGLSGQLKEHIEKFVEESKKNIAEINAKIASEQNTLNSQLHTQTSAYETILKRQIQLLNENKILTQKKEQQDALFNSNIEQLTNEYEAQIKEFEQKVKANVKRIQDLSGGNIINRLLKNDKFRSAMQARGCSL